MTKTIIDRQAIENAVSLSGVELHENFQPYGDDQTCLAIDCETYKSYTQFMIELASQDAALATNLHDCVGDVGVGAGKTFFFPGFDLEDLDDVEPDEALLNINNTDTQ